MTELKHALHYGTGLQSYNPTVRHACNSESLDRELQLVSLVSKNTDAIKVRCKTWQGFHFTNIMLILPKLNHNCDHVLDYCNFFFLMSSLITTQFNSEGRRKDNDCTTVFTKFMNMQAIPHLQCLSRHKQGAQVTSISFSLFLRLKRRLETNQKTWHSHNENRLIAIPDHVSKGINSHHSVHSVLRQASSLPTLSYSFCHLNLKHWFIASALNHTIRCLVPMAF